MKTIQSIENGLFISVFGIGMSRPCINSFLGKSTHKLKCNSNIIASHRIEDHRLKSKLNEGGRNTTENRKYIDGVNRTHTLHLTDGFVTVFIFDGQLPSFRHEHEHLLLLSRTVCFHLLCSFISLLQLKRSVGRSVGRTNDRLPIPIQFVSIRFNSMTQKKTQKQQQQQHCIVN